MTARRGVGLLVRLLVLVGILVAIPVSSVFASTREEGGSGLVDVDHAWSMPITAFILSTYGGTLSSDASPRSTRFFNFTPSATKGLGAGFEAAAAIPFEGLSQDLDDDDFDRRFDVRRRDVRGKVRWSGSLGTHRARIGVQLGVGLPLEDFDRTRPGGTKKPDEALDPSFTALFSTNVGWFSFPLRLHLNVGRWWSRDDGAVYYRTLPVTVPLGVETISNNDVATLGVAAEFGLRRAIGFVEVYTEQLIGARAQIHQNENLWRLTPGVRIDAGRNVSITASISFDVSKDEDSTDFDPAKVFPSTQLRVGVSLGNVLSRATHERERRRSSSRSGEWPLRTAAELDSVEAYNAARAAREAQAAREAAAEAARIASAEAPAVAPSGATWSGGVSSSTTDELARRVARLEEELRLRDIETRLAMLESRGFPAADRATGVPAPVASAPRTSPSGSREGSTGAPVDGSTSETAEGERTVSAPGAAGVAADAPTGTVAAPPSSSEDVSELAADVAALREELRSMPATAAPADVLTTPASVAEQPGTPAAATPGTDTPAPAATPSREGSGTTTVAPTTILRGGQSATRPSVTVVEGPASTPYVQVPAGDVSHAGATGTDATDAADVWAEFDALLAEIETGAASPAADRGRAPAAAPARSEGGAPAAPADRDVGRDVAATGPPAFPLALGEQIVIAEGPGSGALLDAALRDALDQWSTRLQRHDGVAIGVLVFSSETDRAEALAATDQRASTLRDYLIVSGVDDDQVVAIGMGTADERGDRVVLERMR